MITTTLVINSGAKRRWVWQVYYDFPRAKGPSSIAGFQIGHSTLYLGFSSSRMFDYPRYNAHPLRYFRILLCRNDEHKPYVV